MNPTHPLPRWKYYIGAIVIGSTLNAILLLTVLLALGFSGKSFIALLFTAVPGYFYKAFIFFSPFLFLNRDFALLPKFSRTVILFLPFIFSIAWFGAIIALQINALAHEISFGYTDRFPHFYIHLLSTLMVCLFIKIRVEKRLSHAGTRSKPINSQ
jgi:hypothetical protein